MFLGLDFGTSSVKAILVDGGAARASPPLPRPGGVPAGARLQRTGPRALVAGTGTALAALRRRRIRRNWPRSRASGCPGRCTARCCWMHAARCCVPASCGTTCAPPPNAANWKRRSRPCTRVAGNLAMPGFTAPKLLWVRRHEPAIFAADRASCCCPRPGCRFRLTGELIEEMSDASGTLWLDVGRRDWSDGGAGGHRALAAPPCRRLVEGSAPAGSAAPGTGRGAGACGAAWWWPAAPATTPPAAVGLGAMRPGDAFVSLGTSGVLWATTDRFAPYPQAAVHAFCHALPGLWHQMGVTLSAAASLAWWAEVTGHDRGRR